MSEHDNLPTADGKPEELQTEVTEKTDSNIDSNTEATNYKAPSDPLDTLETEVTAEVETPEEAAPEDQDEVINEIEESNAEDAEDEGNADRHEIAEKDYDKMSMEALVNELDDLVSKHKVQAVKKHVEEIRSEFKTQFNTLLDEKKEEFLNEGGNEIDFFFSSPLQKRFKDTYKEYKGKLHVHHKKIENNLKDNLANRLEIIEEIKGLFNDEENINTTYKHFKELQDRWKTAGPIPRDKYNNAWNSYHHHVEVFYDFLHINRDLRDLDFKHNLDQKLRIIERAEELAQDDNLNRAFRELQVLHKMWKEELGPVDKEHREDVWNRFKTATKTIHDRRQVHFAELEEVYEKNLEVKNEIIEQINIISERNADSHNSWQKSIKVVEEFRTLFFSAGKVPIKVNEETWAKFKDAVRNFNRKKNAFYKNLKKAQFDNLQKKMDLIQIAEDNKESEDFDATTALMKKIQNDWKKIGHVPRKNSDKIWKQFKSACNYFFDRLHKEKDAVNAEGNEAYTKKAKMLDELKNMELSGEKETDLASIKAFIENWKLVGNVPSNKRYIEGKLNKALDGVFKKLNLNKNEAELIKFENKLESLNNSDDSRHLDNERQFISKRINEVKSEINQLENNLQFFKNVKDDNPLVQEVHKNIEKHKQELNLWKTKLRKIKELY
ncbi:DUF349 domain-containing protein [Bizionia argentinensis JUB59]|uniref:DUF349 domain-containing protein n=1 Tax=Bizionia argentinensis JUB59 TaxID=1046627 RepID=G2E8Y4_9FLAO|nr:DUF349 domain-containing protein [Bizionia argentinensis]EGV45103.1 DUF349 domain-containing protein [Bizionia argentinensis JUB59]